MPRPSRTTRATSAPAPEPIRSEASARAGRAAGTGAHDPVNHPSHYTSHPANVECITVVEHMSFNLGNAVKYIWRADLKGDAVEDLKKSVWYIQREIERRQKGGR